MGNHLPGQFDVQEEDYEGFGTVRTRVRILEQEVLAARDAVYDLNDNELADAVDAYLDWTKRYALSAAIQQMRSPIREFSWPQRLLMVWDSIAASVGLWCPRKPTTEAQRLRGKRRNFGTGRPAG